MMYQDIGKMNTALCYLEKALKKTKRLLGEKHIQTVVCYHVLVIAFNYVGAFKLFHQTYDVLVKQLGEDDPGLRDADECTKTERTSCKCSFFSTARAALDLLKVKKSLQLGPHDHLYLEGFASNVFAKIDKQDRLE